MPWPIDVTMVAVSVAMLGAFKMWELHTELAQQRKEQAQLWRILGTVPHEWMASDEARGGWYRDAPDTVPQPGKDFYFASLQPPGFLLLTVRLSGDVVLKGEYASWTDLDEAARHARRPEALDA